MNSVMCVSASASFDIIYRLLNRFFKVFTCKFMTTKEENREGWVFLGKLQCWTSFILHKLER